MRSRPPTYDGDHNKLTKGVSEKQVIEAIDRRLEGKKLIEKPLNVVIGAHINQFWLITSILSTRFEILPHFGVKPQVSVTLGWPA